MIFPTVPDNTYKFLLYIGLIFIGFCIFQSHEENKEYNLLVEKSNSKIDTLEIKSLLQKREKDRLKVISSELSRTYGIKDPISENDSVTLFDMTLKGSREEVLVSDSLRKIWNNYEEGNFEIELLSEKIRMSKANLATDNEKYDKQNYSYLAVGFLGILLVFGGYIGMDKLQKMQEKLIQLEISTKEQKYKYCQSCGKNFSVIRKNGTNENGETNQAFCIDCFDDGKFKQIDITLEIFQSQAESMCKNEKELKLLKRRFSSLERWITNDYI